jgi:uncharacterized alpha-E superfamily protein
VTRSVDQARKFLQLVRPRGSSAERSAKALAELRSQLDAMSMDEVLQIGLHKTLLWIVDSIAGICAAVQEEYFLAPTQVRRHRAAPRRKLARIA